MGQKDLEVSGEEWFRDTLVDADIPNNSASWLWDFSNNYIMGSKV